MTDPLIRYPVFQAYTPGKHRRLLAGSVVPLVEDYAARGLMLTGRQVFYQLVARALVVNTFASYRSVMTMLKKARRGGYLAFEDFEDRSRSTYAPVDFPSLAARLAYVREHLARLPRWAGQPIYVEMATEKDALVGFLQPLADELHVPVSSTRGNDGDVHLFQMARRFRQAHVSKDTSRGVLVLATDHDPTGIDMLRDVQARLALFGADAITVERIALTLEQVRQFRLPENPLKLKDDDETYSDARARTYIATTEQTTAWELDAMPPEMLIALFREAVLRHRDETIYARVLRREARDLRPLDQLIQRLAQ
jgi:hypothetical protein